MKTVLKKLIPYSVGIRLRKAYQWSLHQAYKGNNYYCPFCDNHFRKMLPGGESHPVISEKQIIGAGRRPNAVCPRCFSTDRDRLVYLYLKEETTIFSKPAAVLHIAPEKSLKHMLEKQNHLNYVAGDKFEEGYTDYYYDRDVVSMDVTDIREKDNSYDLILCNHVLEHIVHDTQALSEIYRVLKPDGKAILQVPVSKLLKKTEDKPLATAAERERQYGQHDHVRLYGQDYQERLENAGFCVETRNPVANSWTASTKKYAVNPEEILYIAKKCTNAAKHA